MCAFRCALLLCGLAVALHRVWAAPHCVRKPTTTVKPENQCIMDYREFEGKITVENRTIGDNYNFTCAPRNRPGAQSLVLSIAFVDASGVKQNSGNREIQYMQNYPNNGTIWTNVHCSGENDKNGNNIIYFKNNGSDHRVRFVRCSERFVTYEVAEANRTDPNYAYFVWNLDLANSS